MNRNDDRDRTPELVFEYELDAPPEKVWRAVGLATFRERWLPDDALADPEPVSSVPGREVVYRMRDDQPPFFESLAVFQLEPGAEGGTRLRIVHRLTDARLEHGLGPVAHGFGPVAHGLGPAANDNRACLMRAA